MTYYQANDYYSNIETARFGEDKIIEIIRKIPVVLNCLRVNDKRQQRHNGDLAVLWKYGRVDYREVKTEIANKYGNTFIETWSNRPDNEPVRRKLGWAYDLDIRKCRYLYYLFLEDELIYEINWAQFKKWFFLEGNYHKYEEKLQWKNKQLNKTYGRVIPIDVLERQRFTRNIDWD